jgi:hypothetical protein
MSSAVFVLLVLPVLIVGLAVVVYRLSDRREG